MFWLTLVVCAPVGRSRLGSYQLLEPGYSVYSLLLGGHSPLPTCRINLSTMTCGLWKFKNLVCVQYQSSFVMSESRSPSAFVYTIKAVIWLSLGKWGTGQERVKLSAISQSASGSLGSILLIKLGTSIPFLSEEILILHTVQSHSDYYTLLKINFKKWPILCPALKW